MKIVIAKNEDGTRTVHAKPTRRDEKYSSWYYAVPKAQLNRVIDQVVAECKGEAEPIPF